MDFSRRFLIGSGIHLLARAATAAPENREAHRFATAECDIQMTVEFHDRYVSRGFWFNEGAAGRHFCLSLKGERNQACAAAFAGSLAIARYEIRPRSGLLRISTLREHVSTIDRDARLDDRSPLDRTMEIQRGVVSDLQAFGYEGGPAPALSDPMPEAGPWYYFRQDLFLEGRRTPFLVIHWKHALSAIRMLDVIPGEGTWLIRK